MAVERIEMGMTNVTQVKIVPPASRRQKPYNCNNEMQIDGDERTMVIVE